MTMTLKEFVDEGYLQEINRCVLHPLGIALAVTIDDDDPEVMRATEFPVSIVDHRDDPEGMCFAEVDKTKAQNIARIAVERAGARAAKLGYIIQDYKRD